MGACRISKAARATPARVTAVTLGALALLAAAGDRRVAGGRRRARVDFGRAFADRGSLDADILFCARAPRVFLGALVGRGAVGRRRGLPGAPAQPARRSLRARRLRRRGGRGHGGGARRRRGPARRLDAPGLRLRRRARRRRAGATRSAACAARSCRTWRSSPASSSTRSPARSSWRCACLLAPFAVADALAWLTGSLGAVDGMRVRVLAVYALVALVVLLCRRST